MKQEKEGSWQNSLSLLRRGKSQAEIAAETGIYRTTVSRMLTKAKSEGIVK